MTTILILGACAFVGFLLGWWLRGVLIGVSVVMDDSGDINL